MKLLSLEDFQETKIGSDWTRFDCLLEVAMVAEEKIHEENLLTREREEKKKSHWGLKYFSDIIVFKEEDAGLKQDNIKRKRQRKEEEDEEGEGEELKLKRSKKYHQPVCPSPPPFLPENLQQYISEKGGSDLALVIQKPLFKSDVNSQASRFSIPFSQIQTHGFLTKKEAAHLDAQNSIKVCLLEPSMKEKFLSLKRWNMRKSSMYVLTTQWNSVVLNNGLQVDDVVQLWSFRVESTLCFVLVKVPNQLLDKNN